MNAEQQQAVQDIVENLSAVNGQAFARVVLAAVQASNLLSMIANYDPEEPEAREAMREVSCGVVSRLMAEMTTAHGFDHREVMQWADRISERFEPTKH